MNGTNITHGELNERSLKVFARKGSLVEAIGGFAAIVLAIIGLAGSMQIDMMAIATIVLGASFILEGGAIAASFRRALSGLEGKAGSPDLGAAATLEFLAGCAAIVLGALALLRYGAVNSIISSSVIVLGGALLLSSTSVSRLHSAWSSAEQGAPTVQPLPEAVGGHTLVGAAAVALGILALLGTHTVTLNLVALLVLGVSVLRSGMAFGARAMTGKRAT